jgi:hypothetical protein
MERRQAHRLYPNQLIECRAVLQDQGSTFATRARVKNISRGGAYLECDTEPQLFPGEIGLLTFSAPAGQPGSGAVRLAAKARVCRLDRQQGGRASFGLAVEFLSGPLIFYQE